MAFERYIKIGGKTYGPYVYENKRVDGKTVSNYVGKSGVKKKNSKLKNKKIGKGVGKKSFVQSFFRKSGVKKKDKKFNFFEKKFLFFGLFLFLLLGLFVGLTFTGQIVLIEQDSFEKTGILKFSLVEEFIPASTTVLIETLDNSYEYLLSDLALEKSREGSFILDSISGSGLGYGITYPIVYFTLQLPGGGGC
jgi:hypothetical protein